MGTALVARDANHRRIIEAKRVEGVRSLPTCSALTKSGKFTTPYPLSCCERAHWRSFSVVWRAPLLKARFWRLRLDVYRLLMLFAAVRNVVYNCRSISSSPLDSAFRFLLCVISFLFSMGNKGERGESPFKGACRVPFSSLTHSRGRAARLCARAYG